MFATPEDRTFWEQLLRNEAYDAQATSFSMSLLKFLHAEYRPIAARWSTPAERHQLWQEAYLSGHALPHLILQIENELLRHRVANSATAAIAAPAASAASAPIFHATAQRIFEQKRKESQAAADATAAAQAEIEAKGAAPPEV